MKTLVNCTNHPINVYRDGKKIATLPPSGQNARLVVNSVVVDEVMLNGHKLKITRPKYETITGLPEPADGVLYIVSRSVAFALSGRTDLVHVGYRVRDQKTDRLLGCDSFFAAPDITEL